MSGRGQSRLEMLQQCHLVTVLIFVWEQLVDGGPTERQERGKDVWILLSSKPSQFKAKFLTDRTL